MGRRNRALVGLAAAYGAVACAAACGSSGGGNGGGGDGSAEGSGEDATAEVGPPMDGPGGMDSTSKDGGRGPDSPSHDASDGGAPSDAPSSAQDVEAGPACNATKPFGFTYGVSNSLDVPDASGGAG